MTGAAVTARFSARAASLADCATLDVDETEDDGWLETWMRLRPNVSEAVGVVLYLTSNAGRYVGTVAYDDQASVPAELGDDLDADIEAIDSFIDAAVEGRVTAYHLGKGGAIEERTSGKADRRWLNALPLPGWRSRALTREYQPYR